MADDLLRMEFVPGNVYNFHPGSHTGQGVEVGITEIAETLNAILTPEQTTTVLLETMAGKGSEVGSRFEELREIMDRVELKDKLAGEDAMGAASGKGGAVIAAAVPHSKRSEAQAALAVLGYGSAEIAAALRDIDMDALPLEDIIRQALKKMMK